MSLTNTSPQPASFKPAFYQRVMGVLRLTHFFPTTMVLITTLVFALIASRGGIDWSNLVRVWLVVLCGHSAIGITNDYLDRQQDAISQLYKPIPSGLVSAGFARTLIIALLVANALICLTLPLPAILLNLVCTASGMLYNFRLKNTWLSFVPYLLSFSSLPLFVWAGLGRFEPKLLWLYPPTVLLLIGINLANTLPDIENDLAHNTGAHGLGHLLGTRRALGLTWLLFTTAPLICLGLSFFIVVNQLLVWLTSGLALGLIFISYLIARRNPTRQILARVWQLCVFATAIIAVGWLAALML